MSTWLESMIKVLRTIGLVRILSTARPSSSNQKTHKHELFRLGTWNVGTLRDRAGEIETLNRRKIDICCVQEVRWRGASTRTVSNWEK